MSIKKLYKQAQSLAEEVKEIATSLFDHNSGISNKEKIPLENIQQSVACFMRNCAGLYVDIGKEIRERNDT